MKKMVLIPGTALMLSAIFYSCNNADSAATPATTSVPEAPNKDSLIKKGAYLVMIMGCNDCHSSKRMSPHGPEIIPELMLGGHPANLPLGKIPDTSLTNKWMLAGGDLTSFSGPWGTSFAANLSSDQTGLGGWTLERFSKALREGKYNGIDGSRPILPPMPWQNYVKMSDADLEAVFTYLQSTPPVKNLVPQPLPPGGIAQK